MMSKAMTPEEKFWDHQRDGLNRIRKDLLKKNSLNKTNSRASGGRSNSLSKADREREAKQIVRRTSVPNRSTPERSSSQVSYNGVPSRNPTIVKDGVPHKVLIGRPDAFKGKATQPVPEPRKGTPPSSKGSQHGSPAPRNATPPSQLPRMKAKPSKGKDTLRRSKYNVVPPVPPRRAFYQHPGNSNDDSWGETESDDSSYEDDGFMGPYPYPIYIQPQPVFAPPPMYYHRPRRRHKHKKKIVIHEPPKPYTMNQATHTVDDQATQWYDPEAGKLFDVGIDPMNPYLERMDRSVGTFDVRRGDTTMTTESERERRRNDRERWERERREYEEFLRQKQLEEEERRRREQEAKDRSYEERKAALERDRAYREKLAREEAERRRHREGIDFVADDGSSDSQSDLYQRLKARHGGIEMVSDDPLPPEVAQRLREDSSSHQGDSYEGSAKSNSVVSLYGKQSPGSVKSITGAYYSPPASYKNDPRDPPPDSLDSPVSYEEITIPVPNVYASNDPSSSRTLGPSRAPRFYYHYTQTRPRYLQDGSNVFDDRTNSVLRRYKFGAGIPDYSSPDGKLPRDLEVIKYFLDYPDFADAITEALIADFLDEELIPDVLIDTISHMHTLPASHPMFNASKQVADEMIDTQVIWMARGIVGEVAREFAEGYLEEQFNQKKDPLEEFLDDLFYEVVFDGATEAAREAVLEMADLYVMNSSIFDYLTYMTDEIIREEAASVLDDALRELILEDFMNEEVIEELIEEESSQVAREVLTEYDTKLRRKTVKDIDRLGRDKLLDSLILNDVLRRIAHQAKIWTESEYVDKVFNSMVTDILLHEYLDVQDKRKETVVNRPLRKVHEKMVTDVALDVLLDELCQDLDEDLGELDSHEVGGLPDEAAPANIHMWLYGQVEPMMQPTPDASIHLPDDFAPAVYQEQPLNTGQADDLQ